MTSVRTISVAVRDLYERVLADEVLRPYFDGVDMEVLRRHQTDFLFMVLQVGRERRASDVELGRRLSASHAGLGVDDADYQRLVDHLAAALEGVASPRSRSTRPSPGSLDCAPTSSRPERGPLSAGRAAGPLVSA